MNHQTLYRKWRPQLFSQIIGQKHVTETLSRAIETHRLSHAYLFAGPRGTGKTTTARILAKAINCIQGPTAEPCGVCDACVGITDGSYLDLIEIDAASHRRVEETRNVLETIPLSPAHGRKKVYIIDEVHMLTTESSNTLLKTLEEPPDHVIFVLATTDPQDVLPTIQSRCQRFDFRTVDAVTLAAHLRHIAEEEGIHADEESLLHIARSHGGSVRDAIGTLEQLWMFCPTGITSHDVSVMLGTTELNVIFEAAEILESGSSVDAIGFMRRLTSRGTDLRHFVQDLCRHYRDLLLLSESPSAEHLIETSPDRMMELSKQASAISPRRALDVARRLQQAQLDMRDSSDPLLTIEVLVLGMLARNAEAALPQPSTGAAPAAITARPSVAAAPAPRSAQAQPTPAYEAPTVTVPPAQPRPVPQSPDAAASAPLPEPPAGRTPAAAEWSGNPGEVNDLESLTSVWPMVIEMLRQMNKMSTSAYLRMARLADFTGDTVTVAFRFDNHMKRMDSPENKDALRSVLQERVIGRPVTLRFVVDPAIFDAPAPMAGAAPYMAAPELTGATEYAPSAPAAAAPASAPAAGATSAAPAVTAEVSRPPSSAVAPAGPTVMQIEPPAPAPAETRTQPPEDPAGPSQVPAAVHSAADPHALVSILIDDYGAIPADDVEVEFPVKPEKKAPRRRRHDR